MVDKVSFRTIINKYNAFLIDIYGVLRHASGAYPRALPALQQIEQQGKKIIFFSNTADRLPDSVAEKLRKHGFKATEEQVVTSGMALELAFQQWELVGKPIISVGNQATTEYIKRAGGRGSANWREAEASVLGYFFTESNREQFYKAVNLALAKGKPAILANTDMLIPLSENEVGLGPGSIGEDFELATGQAPIEIGKPHHYMYELAFKKLEGIPRREILAIGDSLDYDIQGAINEGLDSLLVLSGLQGIITPGTALHVYMKEKGLYPTYILPHLSL